jgi:hypothetical protein
MNQNPDNKNQVRDLMEYLLLISFVFLGSSYVVVSEFNSAQDAGKSVARLGPVDGSKARHPHVIFGYQTKRHIK